ncbi:peptidoglycan-binding protein LysM [Spirochaetia bacterium]|nr:peptidoglycan-binding protein LysM [Spirochaetia bacterium]
MKTVYIYMETVIKNDESADIGQMKLRSRFLWLILVVDALAFAAPAAADEKVHVIQKGDTIYSLARTFGVSSQDILDLNGIKDAGRIQAGQKIRIPGPLTPISASSKRQTLVDHEVKSGETLYGIARQYGISVQALCSANNRSENYKVKIGERLKIPRIGPAIAVLPPALKEEIENSPPPDAQNPALMVSAPETISAYDVRATVSRALDQSVPWPILAREMAYMTGKLNGVVLMGERNEPVKSLTQGVVISTGPYRGFGKVAIIQVTGGYLYVYGGCESLSVREGDRVNSGTELGRLGMDALSEKPQLFFLVYRNSVSMDPALAPRT